jgi:hypothetical protein
MASLDQFNPAPVSSIDDFKVDANTTAPVSNRPSNVNLAAHAAAMTNDPKNVVDAFTASNAELDMTGKSQTAQDLVGASRDAAMGANKAALVSYLADPNVSDVDKQRAAAGVYDQTNAIYSTSNVLSNMALSAPAGTKEPVETETARISMADAINEVNDVKRQKQALLNQEVAKADPDMGKALAGFLETLTPGLPEKHVGSIANGLMNGEGHAYAAAAVLMGQSQAAINNTILQAPPEKRMEMIKKVVDMVNQQASIALPGDNDYARVDQLRKVLEDGYYTDFSQVADNITSVLDMTVLGGVAARAARGAGNIAEGVLTGGRLERTAASNFERDAVRTRVQPTTVSQNYKDTNPQLATAAHEAAAADNTEQAAQALYGTSRTDAVGSDILPQVAKKDGSVDNKVGRPERINDGANTPNPEVMDFVNHDGAIYYWQGEKRDMRSRVVNNFEQAKGMNARKEMFQVDALADGVGVKAVYGPPQGGFGSAQEAMDIAKWSLRDSGIDESAITILKREGSDYVPSTVEEMNALRKPQTLLDTKVPLRDAGEPVQASRPFIKDVTGDTRYLKDDDKLIFVSPEAAATLKKSVGTSRRGIVFDDRTGQALVERGTGSPDPASLVQASKTPKEGLVPVDVSGPKPKFGNAIAEIGNHPTTSITSSVKVTKATVPDFLVQVDHTYKFSPGDVAQWAEADVKYNIFDRIDAFNGSGNAGSLQRHILDAHSMLHPNITLGANVAVDKAAGLEKELLKVGDNFAAGFKALPKDRQNFLNSIIKDANEQGIDFNYNKLVADGVTGKEMQVLKDWREYWDTVYHLENRDLAKSLRAQNYHEFVDETQGGTRLFAKPVSRNQVSGDIKIYDHNTDKIRTMRADEVADLYAKDGTIARLRQPIRAEDDAAEYIASVQAPGKNYLRALNDNTQVLNYRKGYYSVHYKDPHFIVKVEKNSRGETLFERAVATAGNAKDADLMVKRMEATDGGTYYRRGDQKKVDMSSNNYWDLQQSGGRSAQKVRGKRLEDATSTITDPAMTNILGPVDSMIASARSVSRRVAMRDFTEATKTRFMKQFEDFLPTGKYGQKVFPNSIDEVMHRPGKTPVQKDLADARTTFEYIRYLENGYINHIDDGYKATLKALSDVAGSVGLSKVERGLGWMSEGRGPTAMGKNIAFNMYLATNPFRQFIVQSHQAVQLAANFPRWVLSGKAVPEVTILTSYQMGYKPAQYLLKGAGLTEKEAYEMFRQFERTGQAAAVDKQNLIRGALTDVADTVAGGKLFKFATAPLNFMRKVGFDAGENVNTMTAWLAHRDQALRAGEDFSKADVQDKVAGMARNYTYNMNAAGDLPYNQNALAAVFQFMQVPHKALTSFTLNRVMTPVQKARLVGFNALMYTLPPAAMYSLFGDVLPDDPKARDAVVQGLEGLMLNKLVELGTGEQSRIDFSGLSPMDLYGSADFIHSLFTTDVGGIISATPSGQLFFGNNPRLTNFAKTAARYFNLVDDYTDPTSFGVVANDFAKLSSGYSNAFKAAYALKYGNKINTTGGITDNNVTRPEAIAQVFGFATLDEAQSRYVNDTTYKKTKAYEDDVRQWYKDFKKHVVAEGNTGDQQAQIVKTYSEAWRVWGNDDVRARQIIQGELQKDVASGDTRMYQSVMRMNNMMSPSEVKTLVQAMPGYDETKRKAMLDTLDFMNSYKENKENK